MKGPENDAEQYERISLINRLTGAVKSKEIKSGKSQYAADNMRNAQRISQKETEERDKNDVQCRNKTGFAGSRIKQADLLQRRAGEENKAENGRRADYRYPAASGRRRVLSLAEGPPDQGENGDGADEKTDAVEGEGADGAGAYPLSDEGRSPEEGGRYEHESVFQQFRYLPFVM